jgi:hypothetical protein
LNAFDSSDAIHFEFEEPLEEYFWSKPHTVSLQNSYWTEAAKIRGGLRIDNLVFEKFAPSIMGYRWIAGMKMSSTVSITVEEPVQPMEEPPTELVTRLRSGHSQQQYKPHPHGPIINRPNSINGKPLTTMLHPKPLSLLLTEYTQ